ncbi:hypothetical protein [Jejuia pallidilutea]|uniref:Uncharacterized protein n=1 Tax=Jejuia pallidilutea TaxID=504487 RepID=A0A090W0Y1_9FLAO|nr:hypothetical protein [Jejuia pallidilutea]GAL66042.1 hypothetical protein JCM19301_607 [Jejuia pallidilutea]GAL70556.1 hypothetical protein JCM19302_1465 [Jejuia pallidilutea]
MHDKAGQISQTHYAKLAKTYSKLTFLEEKLNKKNTKMRKTILFQLLLLLLIFPANAQVQLIKETKVTDEALHFWYPNGERAAIYAKHISLREIVLLWLMDTSFLDGTKEG